MKEKKIKDLKIELLEKKLEYLMKAKSRIQQRINKTAKRLNRLESERGVKPQS